MKLKVLFLLFLSLCLCFSDARKLKSRRTSGGDKPIICTTLKLVNPKTGEKMLSSTYEFELIFCSDITIKGTVDESDLIQSLKEETVDESDLIQSLKEETVDETDLTQSLKEETVDETNLTQSPKKPATIFGFHYTRYYPNFFYETDTEIEYYVDTNVWSISWGTKFINIEVKGKSLFYRIAYDLYFFLNKLMLSKKNEINKFTKQQVDSLGEKFENYVKSLSHLKGLIEYINERKDYGVWENLVAFINLLSRIKTSALKVDLKKLFAELHETQPAILDMWQAIKNNKDEVFNKTINLLIKRPELYEYFDSSDKANIFKCFVDAKEYKNAKLFIKKLQYYKYDEVNNARLHFKGLFSENVEEPVQDYKNEYLKVFEIDDGLNKENGFEKLKNFYYIFNFQNDMKHNLFFSDDNKKAIQHFLTFIECFEYNENIQFKNIKLGEMNKLIRLLDLNTYNAYKEINNVGKIVPSIEKGKNALNRINLKSGFDSSEKEFIINSDTKDTMLSLFNGLDNSQLISFLKDFDKKLKLLGGFTSIIKNLHNDKKRVQINELHGLVNPFIISYSLSPPKKAFQGIRAVDDAFYEFFKFVDKASNKKKVKGNELVKNLEIKMIFLKDTLDHVLNRFEAYKKEYGKGLIKTLQNFIFKRLYLTNEDLKPLYNLPNIKTEFEKSYNSILPKLNDEDENVKNGFNNLFKDVSENINKFRSILKLS
jgi:hypothetical protein